jgi:hypothetical protein
MATTNTVNANVTVKFVVNEKGNPPGKLADAELHFNDGVLAGLKLMASPSGSADPAVGGT